MKTFLFLSFLLSAHAYGLDPVVAPPASVEELLKESQTVDWNNAVTRSVVINAPLEKVWRYASDSTQAKDWSVYFDHISPLPGKIPDGQIGSLRRCFRNKDETGEYWDEVTINAVPQQLRQIVTYNFGNFPLRYFHKNEYVFVRQLYRAMGPGKTEMTFQTISRPASNTVFKWLFSWSEKETGEIFQLNLENIRAAVEGQPRLYPWR